MHRIAYLAPEYGALTSTFIYREVAALRSLGYEVSTFSTLRPKDAVISGEARQEVDNTLFLYTLPKGRLLVEAIAYGLRHPFRVGAAKFKLFHDLFFARVAEAPDRPKFVWHFVMGCVLAGRLRANGIEHLHIHFAHVPASIGMYAALAAGIPYSFMGHANDIFQRGTALREKVARSAFTACISEYNVRYLTRIGCEPERMKIVRCAIDAGEYTYREPEPAGDAPVIFSVGRLIEKKGMEYLIDAVAELHQRGLKVQCRIAGSGPLEAELIERVRQRELEHAVQLLGSQPQERVRELLREADVFALACVEAANRDIDGIPVSLMEAMAMGVPVVSTTVSGIPELIEDGVSGVLAAPRDSQALADALQAILTDSEKAVRYSQAARERVATEFECMRNARLLAQHIEAAATHVAADGA